MVGKQHVCRFDRNHNTTMNKHPELKIATEDGQYAPQISASFPRYLFSIEPARVMLQLELPGCLECLLFCGMPAYKLL